MKITKIKNAFKDFTDSVGLTFDPEHHDIEDEDDVEIESPAPTFPTRAVPKDGNINILNNTDTKTTVDNNIQEDCQTIFVNPKNFTECKKIADYIKNDKVVTLNLENVNGKDAQRILDFLSGAISIKEAKWIPISKNVFTSVPKNINFLYDGKNDLKQNTFLDINHD